MFLFNYAHKYMYIHTYTDLDSLRKQKHATSSLLHGRGGRGQRSRDALDLAYGSMEGPMGFRVFSGFRV